MPVIPVLWETEAGRSLEPRSLRPAWKTWQNPVSTKITKKKKGLAGRGDMCLFPATQEAEMGGSPEPRR